MDDEIPALPATESARIQAEAQAEEIEAAKRGEWNHEQAYAAELARQKPAAVGQLLDPKALTAPVVKVLKQSRNILLGVGIATLLMQADATYGIFDPLRRAFKKKGVRFNE